MAALFLTEYVHARRAWLGVYGDSRIWRVYFGFELKSLEKGGVSDNGL